MPAPTIPSEVLQGVYDEQKRLENSSEWQRFKRSSNVLMNVAFQQGSPFDPRFNAFHWALDVYNLCKEIAWSFFWMSAYAHHYKRTGATQPLVADVNFHVSYFADNCIIRIDSCRDKLALMVWAFYVPFNPERRSEVLDYQQVVERLRCPLKFGLAIRNQAGFLRSLETLTGDGFDRVEKYRHLKIHRQEPRIGVRWVLPQNDARYLFPSTAKEIEGSIRKQYPQAQNWELQDLAEGCYIKGVPFDQRPLKERLWRYDDIEQDARSCISKLLGAAADCFAILRRRPPFRAMKHRSISAVPRANAKRRSINPSPLGDRRKSVFNQSTKVEA